MENTLDEILTASVIEFPYSLTLEDTKELLDYICKKLPAEMNTSTTIYHERSFKIDNSQRLQRIRGTVNIGGMI